MRAIILVVLVLALGGCRSIMDPTFVPTSYAHHEKVYKAPPGPEATDIGYTYSEPKNTQVVNEFMGAANDLITYLEQESGLQPSTIYIQNKLKPSAFNHSYDYALRETFRAKGYTLANASDVFNARLTYEAISKSGKPNQVYFPFAKKKDIYEPFELVLNLYSGNPHPFSVAKTYTLPSFGYTAKSELEDEDKVPPYWPTEEKRTREFRMVGEHN